jgi:threonine dehydrogenase-like Zn-dependent dehydrogenase
MGQLAARVLALTGCELIMVGKHKEKLALAASYISEAFALEDAVTFHLPGNRRVDVVIECTGSAQGLELAARLCLPRGAVVLKSTVANRSELYLAPFVIDEIRVQGSRCGPFLPALRVLQQRLIDVKPLISARYTLDEGLAAFEKARQPGVLKVLVKP